MLYVIIYTLFPVLCSSFVFFYVLQDFGLFYRCFDPKWAYFDSAWMPLSCMPMEEKKNRRMWSQSSPRSVRGGCHDLWYLHFLQGILFFRKLFDFLAVIIPLLRVAIRLPEFYYIKGGSHLHTHPIISSHTPFLSSSRLVEIRLEGKREIELKWRLARILSRVCDRQIQARFLAEQFFSLLFSFPL